MRHLTALRLRVPTLVLILLLTPSWPALGQTIQPISAANAQNIKTVARLGRGTPNVVAWSPDGKMLAVGSYTGIWLYDSTAPDAAPRFLEGHTDLVTSLAFNPDGSLLASGSDDGTARLWEIASGKQRAALKSGAKTINAVSFSPDGQTLVSAGADGMVSLWDSASGTAKSVIQPPNSDLQPTQVAFSPDGSLLAASYSDYKIRTWDAKTGRLLGTLSGHQGPVSGLLFTPDGSMLISSSVEAIIRLWDLKSGAARATLSGHMRSVVRLALNADGSLLAAGADDGRIWLWDLNAQTEKRVLRHIQASIRGIAFNAAGDLASCASDGLVRVWNPNTGAIRHEWTEHQGFNHLIFGEKANSLLTVSPAGDLKNWTLPDGSSQTVGSRLKFNAQMLAASADARTLALGEVIYKGQNRRFKLHLLDGQSGQEQHVIDSDEVDLSTFALSRDGKLLLANSYRTVSLWDTQTGKPHHLNIPEASKEFKDYFQDAAFSPDGSLVAAIAARQIAASGKRQKVMYFWDTSTGKLSIRTLNETSTLKGLVFAPDGQSIVTVDDVGSIDAWDVKDEQVRQLAVFKLVPLTGLAFSPDGSLVAAWGENGSKRNVLVVDVASGTIQTQTDADTVYYQDESVVFSLDSSLVALSSGNDIQLLDVKKGLVATLKGHAGPLQSLTISPDGRWLASSSLDGTIRLWGVQ